MKAKGRTRTSEGKRSRSFDCDSLNLWIVESESLDPWFCQKLVQVDKGRDKSVAVSAIHSRKAGCLEV